MDPLTDLVIHSFRTFLSICFVFEITFRVLANRRRILHNHSEILEIVLVCTYVKCLNIYVCSCMDISVLSTHI